MTDTHPVPATDECGCGGACRGGHDERLAPSPLHNPPGRTALDYRVGEYGSFLAALLDRLASPAYPALNRLTVRTPDDPAIGLLDATAVLGDLLTFHSERIADEAYVRTANEHRSLVLLGRLVGHRPRPGVAAATHVAYTLERDPRAEAQNVLIPRGARSHSVPASADEESMTFETSRDLTARWDFNELKVRRRRPSLVTPRDLEKRSELFVEGTAHSLRTGDQLLFVFGEGAGGERKLVPVADTRVDRDDDVTAISLPQSAPPSLKELVDEVRRWTAPPVQPGEPGEEPPTPEVPNPRPVSRLPSGHENVRARYRCGTGKAANVPAGRVTQPLTRPLGVTAVTNPRPATGGADADGPGLTRRTVPLAVSALDRLVSESDYEDFARSRAASAGPPRANSSTDGGACCT
ncbi:hypothetical protein SVIOM74S_08164 [Streptomyces violarus]